MTESYDIFDITIIGGGPVGLFTAFYANLRTAKTKIIESLDEIGGQPSHLYAEKFIHDIPAYPSIGGGKLGKQLLTQLKHFETTICLGEEALNIKKIDLAGNQDVFMIETSKGIHYSKTIIMAAGNGAFTPRRLKLDMAETYEQNNLHYFVKDIAMFQGKRVAIAGGGDSAVDWALTLEPVAEKVFLIHRRNKFRALEHSVTTLNKSTVETLTPFIPVELKGKDNYLSSIILNEARTDHYKKINIDHFIVSYGFTASLGELKNWGFSFERNAIKVNNQYETSIPGIFAVGDIAQYDGKVKLIATGFGEAPQAVNSALLYIDPSANIAPIHSTSLK